MMLPDRQIPDSVINQVSGIYLNVVNLTDTKYLSYVLVSRSMWYSSTAKSRTAGIATSAQF